MYQDSDPAVNGERYLTKLVRSFGPSTTTGPGAGFRIPDPVKLNYGKLPYIIWHKPGFWAHAHATDTPPTHPNLTNCPPCDPSACVCKCVRKVFELHWINYMRRSERLFLTRLQNMWMCAHVQQLVIWVRNSDSEYLLVFRVVCVFKAI